jgi:hypothetical protein
VAGGKRPVSRVITGMPGAALHHEVENHTSFALETGEDGEGFGRIRAMAAASISREASFATGSLIVFRM